MKRFAPLSACLILVVGMLMTSNASAKTSHGELLVFVQSGKSTVDAHFQSEQLPVVKTIAAKYNLGVRVLEAGKGAPASITATPTVVFQNHRGRSVYQGRFTTPKRLETFIRTVAHIPQGAELRTRTHEPIWVIERLRLGAPVKLTSLEGTPPAEFDRDIFRQQAFAAMGNGLSGFKLAAESELQRSDRLFYFDFYPESDGKSLTVHAALFSQYHCIEPIFSTGDKPFRGPWAKRSQLFAKAATALENAVADAMADTKMGDGLDPVANTVPSPSWEELVGPLPAAPASGAAQAKTVTLPKHWQMKAAGPSTPPPIQFNFPSPLDAYAGVVNKTSGELKFDSKHLLGSMKGFFAADPRSVTMGEPDLDDALQGAIYLHTKKHPGSRFTIQEVRGNTSALKLGELERVELVGVFTMKGHETPMTVDAQLECLVSADGAAELHLRSAFDLDLRVFDIPGADGPEPARHTLAFNVYFVFEGAAAADKK